MYFFVYLYTIFFNQFFSGFIIVAINLHNFAYSVVLGSIYKHIDDIIITVEHVVSGSANL